MERGIEQHRKRISDIDLIIEKLYEDHVLGNLSMDRFTTMAAKYEEEQKTLKQEISDFEKQLARADQANVDLKMLMKGLKEFTEVGHLTPEIVNTVIQRIEVHSRDRSHSHNKVRVDIYYTAIGLFDLPSHEELLKLSTEVHKEIEKGSYSA